MPRPSPVTEEQERLIVEQYSNGVSRNRLAVMFNASRPFITDCLRRHGVQTRSLKEACPGLPLNHAVFDAAASSEAAAYWVGFLMADGCISANSGKGSPHVILVISERDRSHLEQFRSFLGSQHSIQVIPGGKHYGGKSVRLDLASERLADALSLCGVVTPKANRRVPPFLELNRHFWRGLVDGDGWVGQAKKRDGSEPRIALVGYQPIVEEFSAFLRTVTDCAATVGADRSVWQCGAYGRHAVRVIHYLYSDCHVALSRKHKTAKSLIDRYRFLLDPDIGYHWN